MYETERYTTAAYRSTTGAVCPYWLGWGSLLTRDLVKLYGLTSY